MATGSRVCSHCGALNAASEKRCHRCSRRLPGPLAESFGIVRGALGESSPLTRLYVLVCVVVYALMTFAIAAPASPAAIFRRLWQLNESQYVRWGALLYEAPFPQGLGRMEPWRFVSAIFIHFGVLHIVFNSSALLYYGRAVEERIGSARFSISFLVTGVIGFLASDLWYLRPGAEPAISAGASGAIFGLIGVVVGYLFAKRDPEYKRQLSYALMMGLITAIALPVNNAAHAGGLVSGLPLGYLFFKERRPERLRWLMNALAVLTVLASIGSLVLCQRSPWWRLMAQEEDRRGIGR